MKIYVIIYLILSYMLLIHQIKENILMALMIYIKFFLFIQRVIFVKKFPTKNQVAEIPMLNKWQKKRKKKIN